MKRTLTLLTCATLSTPAVAHHGLKHAAVEAGLLSSSYSSQASTRDAHHAAAPNIDAFTQTHHAALKMDAAAGQGETIDTLADFYAIPQHKRQGFAQALKNNYQVIFADQQHIASRIQQLIKQQQLS